MIDSDLMENIRKAAAQGKTSLHDGVGKLPPNLTADQYFAIKELFKIALDVQAENMARMVELYALDMESHQPDWTPSQVCACIAKGLRKSKCKIN